MRFRANNHHRCQTLVRLSAGLALLLVLLLGTLAASPELHELFHPDAGQENHQCAVTVFAHGQLETAATPTLFISAPVFYTVSEVRPEFVASTVVEHLPFGRGPPAALSPLA